MGSSAQALHSLVTFLKKITDCTNNQPELTPGVKRQGK